MSEASRQHTEATIPARPFAAPEAGGDYFATEAHYLSLAGRIVAGLRRGPGLVLLTGDPPPSARVLSPALSNAAAGWYAVVAIACGPELSRDQLLLAVPPSPASLFVFDEADRLSDGQIEGICEPLARRDGITPGLLLLARPPFLSRLEGLQPRLFREGLATRFQLHQLGREEIEPFIRRQLPSGEAAPAFTAEAITAIADFSGADPAVVNRLARLMLEFDQAADDKSRNKLAEGAQPPIEVVKTGELLGQPLPQAEVIAEAASTRPLRHRSAARRGRIAILLCLIAAAVMVSADDVSSFIGSLAQRIAALSPPTPPSTADSANAPAPMGNAAPEASVAEPPPPAVLTSSATSQTALPAETSSALPAAASPVETPAAKLPAPVAEPDAPTAEIAALVARGDTFLQARDVASARLFYERAADAGDAAAAMRMGGTFDPTFLARAGIPNTRGDQREALSWYRRSRDLGDAEAERLLKTFEQH
jgi:hypothetical protein